MRRIEIDLFSMVELINIQFVYYYVQNSRKKNEINIKQNQCGFASESVLTEMKHQQRSPKHTTIKWTLSIIQQWVCLHRIVKWRKIMLAVTNRKKTAAAENEFGSFIWLKFTLGSIFFFFCFSSFIICVVV